MDLTETMTAEMTGISYRSVYTISLKIRRRLAEICKQASPLNGAVEVDGSYLGAHRVRGRRGYGANSKTIVCCLRAKIVYTGIVPGCSKAMLQGIIRRRIDPVSVIHSDGWLGYDGLVDIDVEKPIRVNHGANGFASGECNVNRSESFWSHVKRRMAKFIGLTMRAFYIHLKQTEFRFNHRGESLYVVILKKFTSYSAVIC